MLEAQESFGGTWLTHRYPGIRSDSDLHTFGYRFKPWTSAPIATAAEILAYMGEVIAENGLAKHIRYRHRISSASWSSATELWTIEAVRTDTGEARTFTANFLWMCQGYYRHSEGYTPEWKGMESLQGPHRAPAALAGRSGSRGQEGRRDRLGRDRGDADPERSPTDAATSPCSSARRLTFRTGRNAIELAETLRQLQVSEEWIHEIVRRKILFEQDAFTRRSFTEPEIGQAGTARRHPRRARFRADIEKHFTPRYRPWRQRIAFVPDADLFQAIRAARPPSSPTRSIASRKTAFC